MKGKVNVWILLGGLLVLLPFGLILAFSYGRDPRALDSMLEGKQAPPFVLKTLEGETVSLADLRGKPVVLNFWSTWCQPCKIEHPVLLEAADIYRDVAFYGVIYEDKANATRAYLKKAGAAYPHLIDPGSRTAISYGVAGVPETFFIDHEGRIIDKVSLPVSREQMYPLLEKMLQEAAR